MRPRMFVLLGMLACGAAQATPVRIDFSGTVGFSNWTNPSWNVAGPIEGTILLDTNAGETITTVPVVRSDGALVIGRFEFNALRVRRTSIVFDSTHTLFDLGSGDLFNHSFSGEAPGDFLYEPFFGGGGSSFYQFELGLFPVISAAQFTSFGDPLLEMLMLVPRGGATLFASGDFGRFGSVVDVSTREVPEPASLSLIVVGLTGLALRRRRAPKALPRGLFPGTSKRRRPLRAPVMLACDATRRNSNPDLDVH